MARRRFQKGQLFKSGRRRKVWVGRWREDVVLEEGAIGQVRRWQVLGTVADFASRREAQALLDDRLRSVNAGASRPEASMAFGTFVEEQVIRASPAHVFWLRRWQGLGAGQGRGPRRHSARFAAVVY